ncbi:alpha-2-HS-glycoprotein L homeolog precursor [Xenopus laevis]|uniref:Alpha-2-HS-glycoprotein L homeolog precursor n=1 Tax=Xenopus laevis TaxID=8355 RepID=Q4KLF4_XENLA|nr:alpha-2-HS-glycoprotein L homeolog precursor [Xenopus laevis]AAH99246.1 MGC116429 protein [Xenopus laevis]
MKLLLLSLLFICTTFALAKKPTGRIVDCDSPEANDAALEALHFINANHHHGYKFVVNQVEDIHVLPETVNGEIFYVELDLLESKCPWVSPTPAENCPVRPRAEQAVEGDCKIKLQKQNGNFTVLGVSCKSKPDSAENVFRACSSCPLLAPLNDTQVVHAVDVALLGFNNGNNTVYYKLHEIGRAQIQGPANNKVQVEFVIAASNCSNENAALDSCVALTGEGAHYGSCAGSVTKLPEAQDEELDMQCTVYEPQPPQVDQTGVPSIGVPAQPLVVHGHFHHNLRHSSLGPHSSESNSAEKLLLHLHQAKSAVKRSLFGKHSGPNALRPRCPGKKIFF